MRTVNDILTTKGDDVKTIQAGQDVFSAISDMNTHNIGSLVVMSDETLRGVITERDYARKVVLEGRDSHQTPVEDIMSTQPVVVKKDTSLNECMALMTRKRVRHLPVLENRKLVGLVSIGDVVKEIIEEQNVVIQQLEGYIYS